MFPIPSPCFNASLFWWWRVGLHQSDWCACDRLRFWRGSKIAPSSPAKLPVGWPWGPGVYQWSSGSWQMLSLGIHYGPFLVMVSLLYGMFFFLIRFSWMTTWMQSRVQLATKVILFIVWQMGFKAQFKTIQNPFAKMDQSEHVWELSWLFLTGWEKSVWVSHWGSSCSMDFRTKSWIWISMTNGPNRCFPIIITVYIDVLFWPVIIHNYLFS